MLVRIFLPILLAASPIGFSSSRTSSFQFSFRNVFMWSPKQKVVHRLEIVAINIPTLAFILPSVLLFECVADQFVTVTADGSRQ